MEAHGVVNVVKWIRERLPGKKQIVCRIGLKFEWKHVTSGVPQGIGLGPLLFIMHINYLDLDSESNFSKFQRNSDDDRHTTGGS